MIPIRDDQPRTITPYINYFIIGLNVLVFVFELMVQAQGPSDFSVLMREFGVVPRHFLGALSGSGTFNPAAAFLPVFTSMFLHGGWMHIIGNMWVLWIFGDNIEDKVGHFYYLLFYLLSGFAAAVTQVLLSPQSTAPIIGASGAIAGVMGAYFFLYPKARVLTQVFFIAVWWLPAWVFLGGWFLLQFLSGASASAAVGSQGQGGGIAFWAHVGGFVAGIGLIHLLPDRPRPRYGTW